MIEEAPSLFFEGSLPETPLTEDLWAFGIMWDYVCYRVSTVEELYKAIQEAHLKIEEIKKRFTPLAIKLPFLEIKKNENGGISNSYFLVDATGAIRFVIKPGDEDAGCINNLELATPFLNDLIRKDIFPYFSPMREVLASQIANLASLHDVVPKTILTLIESDQFHDLADRVASEERERYQELIPFIDHEKLCSAQEYIPNATSLFEALHEMQDNRLSDQEISARFDPQSFEEANLLVWLTGDTDAHGGNFLVYPKGVDAIGNEILGLKKIDNGLAFPEDNGYIVNALAYLPNANEPLSEEGKQLIKALDIQELSKPFEKLGLDSALKAFKERVMALKNCAKQPGITLREIHNLMIRLGNKE